MSVKKLEVPFVDLQTQHTALADEIDASIRRVFSRNDFVLGQELDLFEQEFAAFCGTRYAVGVDSGTSALELSLRACGIGPGDEVITAAHTFIATVQAISYTGASPVLVDVDPHTYTIDAAHIAAAITPHTRAIIPVHLYGQPADMDPILALARQHNLAVIEDACQAHGATYKSKRAGSMGHLAAFSFYPAKNLGACGDGGMIITNDPQHAETLRRLRNHGQSQKHQHVMLGYNRRLDTLQAAILRVKLRYLDAWNDARRAHARRYTEALAASGVILPGVAEYADPVWHLYVIRAARRDALRRHLAEHGISTGLHYPIPIYLQPAYRELGYLPGAFPITECCADEGLSLPMYAELTPPMIDYVAATIHAFARNTDAAGAKTDPTL